MYNGFSISLVIPAMNESRSLGNILNRVPVWVDEIIVIDGNSIDDTFEVAMSNQRVSKVYAQRSRGKGAALSLGFALSSSDLIAIIDADGSMDPQELSRYIECFPSADVVKGSRNSKFGGFSDDLTVIRNVGNVVLTKLCNFLFAQKWTDLAYGYAVISRESLNKLGLSSYDEMGSILKHKTYGQGFEIESLIFCRAAKWGFKVVEVPSHEYIRITGSSNLRAIRDGFRVLFTILIEKSRIKPNDIRIGRS